MKQAVTALLALALCASAASVAAAGRPRFISHRGESLDAPEKRDAL